MEIQTLATRWSQSRRRILRAEPSTTRLVQASAEPPPGSCGKLPDTPEAIRQIAAVRATTPAWTLRGGRTLVRQEENAYVHMKFHRQGESLEEFAAEQATQDFAQDHHKQLVWHSEIPKARGIKLVPLEQLPVTPENFPDALEIHRHQGQDCVLALRCTTKDESYDTQAFQPDEEGGFQKSRQGLLNAFHDLGLWSSLGAAHTSAIRLFHHFLDIKGASRPELLLSTCFQPGQLYPGSLHRWNTQATQQSDWGQSGMRDLGDLGDLGDHECYPFIDTYVKSIDARMLVPDYSQRASFVNAIAQNILGGLLHYMRLHRTANPDYHYQKPEAVADMEQFVEQACDALLKGLLGGRDQVRFKDLFAQTSEGLAAVYPEWLHKTAREIIYWSADQSASNDCFADHLKDGRPSAALYPGHPWQDTPYGKHFTEAGGENLGANNSKLPLLYLVRGLYVMAAGLADSLAAPDETSPMET